MSHPLRWPSSRRRANTSARHAGKLQKGGRPPRRGAAPPARLCPAAVGGACLPATPSRPPPPPPLPSPGRVHDVGHNCREAAREELRDHLAAGGPGENLDLAGRVRNYVMQRRLPRLLAQRDDLDGGGAGEAGVGWWGCEGGGAISAARPQPWPGEGGGDVQSKMRTHSQRCAGPQGARAQAPRRHPGLKVAGRARWPTREPRTWSKRVAKRLHDVRMPPLGPRPYCFMTAL
jgi:hypothetical protein